MALAEVLTPQPSSGFRLSVEKISEQKVGDCYQCGKCTAGCPTSYIMDFGPRRVLRAVQLGLEQEALNNSAIWRCISCQTCSARCPRQIDIARVMEALRHLAIARKTLPADKEVDLFHRLFLGNMERWGHIYELGLGGLYNLRSRRLLNNAALFPKLLQTGKLPLLPPRAKATPRLRAIFARVAEIESGADRLKES